MKSWPLLVALALLLAGCASPSNDPEPTPQEPGWDGVPDGTEVVLPKPERRVGDAWKYRDVFENQGQFVVVGEDETHFYLGTDNPNLAIFNANEAISYMGRSAKAHHSGSQGSTDVRFFDFPLFDGKTWSTQWDGETVTAKARVTEMGADLFYERGDGSAFAEARYRVSYGWFSYLEFFDAEGASQYWLEVTGVSRGVNVDSAFLLERVEVGGGGYNVNVPTASTRSFTVPEAARFVAAQGTISCEQVDALLGNLGYRMGPRSSDTELATGGPNDQGGDVPCPVEQPVNLIMDAVPGPWSFDVLVADLTLQIDVDIASYAPIQF